MNQKDSLGVSLKDFRAKHNDLQQIELNNF